MYESFFSSVNDLTLTQYATDTEADAYFSSKFNNAIWTICSAAQKNRALFEATAALERLRFRGARTTSTQKLSFPRDGNTTIPVDIKVASCELAYFLIDDGIIEEEMRNVPMISGGMYSARSTRDTSFIQEHVAAGIPSYTAWTHLTPYLANPKAVELHRVD